jgi:hypothetical protein
VKHFIAFFLFISSIPLLASADFDASSPSPNDTLQVAVNDLYESHFDASRRTLNEYSASHPQDPLSYAMKAATYLFGELERGGALRSNLMSDDRNVQKAGQNQPDPHTADALREAIKLTRKYAGVRLVAEPDDRNALLAMCIVAGVQRDYLALVEHKLRDSYPFIREANGYSKRLLKVDPTAYDAYLTKGFTEYLVANLPFYLRWMMSMDDVTGTREQGLNDMRIAAQSGQYLKPFAQLLLAMFYLREKREDKTEELLAQLMERYPSNTAFRAEFDKLRAKRNATHKTE